MSLVEQEINIENEGTKNDLINKNEFDEITSWDDLDINPDILRGIYSYGLEKPSPIQCKAITPILKKRDIIAQAQSGTGKTAAFTVGSLSLINVEQNTTQVLILSPTRELSIQTANVIKNIGSLMKGLRVQLLVGGTSIDDDINQLKNNFIDNKYEFFNV